jgi:NADPH:quinone reductase-like Zn-dependent oxidoreductase
MRPKEDTMKAIVQNRYGSPDVLELGEVDRPVAGDDQILVRVRAASVHADVWHVMRGVPYVLRVMGAGLRTPKNLVPGTDLAGVVESVGRNVTRFQPGDAVFGQTLVASPTCGATAAPSPSTRQCRKPGSSGSPSASPSNRPGPSPRPDRSRYRRSAIREGSEQDRRS